MAYDEDYIIGMIDYSRKIKPKRLTEFERVLDDLRSICCKQDVDLALDKVTKNQVRKCDQYGKIPPSFDNLYRNKKDQNVNLPDGLFFPKRHKYYE